MARPKNPVEMVRVYTRMPKATAEILDAARWALHMERNDFYQKVFDDAAKRYSDELDLIVDDSVSD